MPSVEHQPDERAANHTRCRVKAPRPCAQGSWVEAVAQRFGSRSSQPAQGMGRTSSPQKKGRAGCAISGGIGTIGTACGPAPNVHPVAWMFFFFFFFANGFVELIQHHTRRPRPAGCTRGALTLTRSTAGHASSIGRLPGPSPI